MASGCKTLANSIMRITSKMDIISDRSRPGLITAATAVGQQGTGGNWTTAEEGRRRQKKRGGKHARRQREKWQKQNMD